MSYFLTEEQELIRNAAREFAQNEGEPGAIDMDLKDEFPADLIQRCAELNFFGINIPVEYGGIAAGVTTACVVVEEISKASPALGSLLMVHTSWPAALVMSGTDYQKQKYLPKSASGECLGALAQTEPAGALNIMAHQTCLTPDGDGYRLNGLKIFCTHGNAKAFLVGARTKVDGKEGYGYVLVDEGAPGFEIGQIENKLGWRGSNTGTVLFKDVYVPKENVVGDLLNGAQAIGMAALFGNLSHSASALGCAEGIYAKTITYVKERNLYGYPMTVLQPISYWLADIYTKIEACRSLLYSTTRMFEEGNIRPEMAFTCKAYICETAFEVSNKCLQMWGGHGIMNDVGINRYVRDARTKVIAECTTEMHLTNIAQIILA